MPQGKQTLKDNMMSNRYESLKGKIKDNPLLAILGSLCLIVGVLFSGWKMGFGTAQAEISGLKTSLRIYDETSKLDLEKLLSNIKNASSNLSINLTICDEVKALRVENADLKKRNGVLTSTLEETKMSLTQKTDLIEQIMLHDETFTLTPGHAKTLGGYSISIGYIEYSFGNDITVLFNNEPIDMAPGQMLTKELHETTCKLHLVSVDWDSTKRPATFSFSVHPL